MASRRRRARSPARCSRSPACPATASIATITTDARGAGQVQGAQGRPGRRQLGRRNRRQGTADAIATNGNFDGVMVQEGAVGALEPWPNAHHPVVPIGVDAGNGTRMIAVDNKYPGVTAAQAPAMSAVALEATASCCRKCVAAKGQSADSNKNNKDLAEGKDFFRNLPKPSTPRPAIRSASRCSHRRN